MHHCATREVNGMPFFGKITAPPYHVPNRQVGEGEPKRQKDEYRAKFHALSKGADNQRRRDDRKGHLECEINRFRDRATDRVHTYSLETNFREITEELAIATSGQAVPVNGPEQGHQCCARKTLHEHR